MVEGEDVAHTPHATLPCHPTALSPSLYKIIPQFLVKSMSSVALCMNMQTLFYLLTYMHPSLRVKGFLTALFALFVLTH